MIKLANWISENCSTVGTGPIQVTGAVDITQARFRDGIPAGPVFYSVISGQDREAGEGTFDGVATITRTVVHATFINGVYLDVSPTPVNLNGVSVVSCTLNADSYNSTLTELASLRADVNQNTSDIATLGGGQTSLEGRVTANEGNIATNAGNIATNGADIVVLDTALGILDADVSFRESAVTALEVGGTVTGNGPTSVLILAGHGEVIDSYSNTEDQITQDVSWPEQTYDLLANAGMPVVTGVGQTTIGVDNAGVVQVFPNGMTNAQRRENIRLAAVEYEGRVITQVTNVPVVSNQAGNTLLDFIDFVDDSLKIKGLLTRPTNIGDLTIWRDAGQAFVVGASFTADKANPNVFDVAVAGAVDTPISFEPIEYNNGTTLISAATNQVSNLIFEPGGGGQTTLTNNNATIHYLVQSLGGNFYLSYGQKEYAGGYADAVNNLFSDKSDHLWAAEFEGMFVLARLVVLKAHATWDGVGAGVYPTNSSTSSSSGAGSATQAVNIGYTDTYSIGGNVQAAIDSLAALKLTQTQHDAVNAAAAPSGANAFATIADIGPSTPDHNNLNGLNVADFMHLTAAELSKLGGIEAGATADQTKADIDALGINAATLDGVDSTGFEPAGALRNVIEDTSPQLGGALDCNGMTINRSNYVQLTDHSGFGSISIDHSGADMREVTATGNLTLNFNGFQAGVVASYIVDAINWGAYVITWPVGTLFAGGAEPTYTETGKDRLLVLKDGKNVYTVHVVDQDIK